MNRIKLIGGAALVLATIASASAWADPTTDQEIAELKTTQQHLVQQARNTKPAAAAPLTREANRLQGVIDSLERGEHVDPSALNPEAGRLK